MRRMICALILSALALSANAANFYSASTGNLENTATWWSNSDGATGTHPANFTANSQVFIIINNTAATISSGWTVSGTGSKIVVGDGVAAVNFTIPATAAVTGTIDVTANAILTITNTVSPTLGILNAASTVNYNLPTGGQTINAATYGNLIIGNSSNTNTASGPLRVNGALTTTSGGTLSMAGFQLLGTLTSVSNNGTITTTNTQNPAIPSGKNWTGTTGMVNFAATTGGQFIPAGTYGALTLSNSSNTNTAVGTVTVNGDLTTTSGGTLTMATFQLAGNPTSVTNNGTVITSTIANPALPSGQNWSGTTGLVTFAVVGGGQFIPAGTYKDLTLNNIAGTNTAVGTLTVNGALTNTSGGTFALSTFQLLGALPVLTNNGIITTLSTANPAIPADKNWSGTTGTVSFAATAGGQFIPAGTYKTLTCANTSGTNTAVGTLTINNALTTTTGGTLAMSTFQLLGTITTLTNNGSITTACTTDPAIPTGRSWSGTTGLVNFAATTGGQTIPVGTYKGLTVSNTSGTTTAAGVLTVNGVLTTVAGGTVDLAAFPLLGTLTSVSNNGTISTSATDNPPIPSGKNWAGTTGQVNFAATTGGQFIPAGTYGALTLSNSSNTNTATGVLRVNGALTTTSGGTLAMGTFQLAGTPTSVTNNGTVITSAIANPAIPSGQSWSGTTGLVTFAATTGAQFIPAGTYKDLTLNNTSGTNTAVGTLTVNGALTNTSGGTLALSTFQLLGALPALTNNGIITTLSTANPAIPADKNWSGTTGTVSFAATTGGQFIPAGTYKTLTSANTSATNTAVGALTVNNALTTTSGGTLAMSTFQLLGTITTLTNNGTITTACTTDPAIPSGRSWSGTTGLVNFAATTGGQTIPVGTYKGLTVSNTSGTTAAAGILTVNGALTTVAGGTVDLAAFQLLGTLTSVTNNGTISTSATDNPAIPTGKNWSGTTGQVNFAATTGGQFIPAGTYGALTLSNSSNTNNATGILKVNGELTTTSGGTLAMGTFQLLGTLPSVTNNGTITTTNTTNPAIPAGKNWAGTTGLVNFAATTGGQSIPAGTYGALTLSNSSNTNTAVGTITVNGDLITTSGGTLAMAAFQLAGTPTSVTNNGTITTSATANPAIPSGQNWSGTTGLVTFAAATGNQYIPGGTYKTLTASNTSNTNTAVGDLNVTGTITTSAAGGTLDMGANALTAAAVTNTGTILTQNTSSDPLPSGLTWAGRVSYNGTDAQTMVAGTFTNLTLSGARASTPAITLASGVISLSGSLTVAYTGDVSFINTGNTFIYTGNSTQTVGGISYNNLTCLNSTGSTPKNAGGNIEVDGTLTTTSGGTLVMGDYQLTGSLTAIANNGTISTTCTLNPALPIGKNWSGTTGLVTFAATTGNQYIPGGTYKTLTCSNTSNTNTVTGGPVMVTGVFTTSGAGGRLDMGANELNATTITINATGTLLTQCTTSTPLPSGRNYGGTVIYNAADGGQTIVKATYKNLTLANTSDTSEASGNLVVNGIMQMSGGGLRMGAFALSGNASFASSGAGTITTANTSAAPLTIGATWPQTIIYNGTTGAQTIVAGTYNAGLINANPVNTNVVAANITIVGDLTLADGSVLDDGGFQLSLSGNIAGTGTHIKTTAGKISMTGSAATISGATLGNLSLDNSGGFNLTGDATINGTLTLTTGSLAIGDHNLTFGATAPAISGSFSSSKMIVINGTGEMRKMFTANGSYLFPLGDNTPNYSPITLDFTGGSYGANAFAGVSVTNTKHPNDASTTHYLNRYWSVAVSDITSPVYSVSATYLDTDIAGDESAISSAMYAGSLPWTKYSAVNTPTNNLSATNVTVTNADFGGITAIEVSVSVLPSSGTICSGDIVPLEATGEGVPPLTYSWSPATGLSATTGSSVLAAPTTGTVATTYVYTVTITDAQGSSSTATATVTVQPSPSDITGDNTICNGSTTTLTNALAGGNWTSDNESVAVITSSEGELSAIAPGTAIITYSTSNGCSKTLQVTVNSVPSVEPILGPSSLCEDAVDYLGSVTEGGTWSSGTPAVATIDAGTGLVTGISGGTSSISYTVTNGSGCSTMVTRDIVINPKPHVQAITGTTSVCFGTTTLLNDATTGGAWLSLDTAVAAVDTDGTVTGTVGVAWDTTVNILYIATNDCGVDTATAEVTVKGLPGVGVMVATNNHQVCLGAQVPYSSTHPGGVWSMSDPTIASIDSITGLLTGVSAGSTTISYTVTGSNGCKKSRLSGITVNPLPPVPSIFTDGLACTGSTITLTGTTGPASYNWTSDDTSVATINSTTGVLVGKSVGTTVITYEYKEACSNYAQTVITVNPTTTASVTGTAVVCASGGTTTLTGAPAGGTWSSSNVLRATVDGSGNITGVGAGTATTTYVYTNGYGCSSRVNKVVTVNATPTVGSVAGLSGLCQGATGLYTNPTPGGVWSTSNTSVATVGSSGIVTGVAPGTMIVSYTVTGSNGCPKSSKLTVTVNAIPSVSAIAGTGTVCAGTTRLLTNASGGTHLWTSDNVSAATVNASTGLVTGVAAGTATISYKYTNICSNYATTVVTVNAVTTASVTGTQVICAKGGTTTLTGAPGSGIWSSSAPSKASVDSTSGMVTGGAAGTATITFKYTNGAGCIYKVYTPVTVNALPSIGGITGPTKVCTGSAITLAHATAGGTWSSTTPDVGSVGIAGMVTGVSAGTTKISYTVTGANGCSASAIKTISVNALPAVAAIAAGSGTLNAGATLALSDATTGAHVWSSSNTSVATVNYSSGLVTGVAPGSATITYAFTSGCTNYATTVITVNASARQAIAEPELDATHINAAISVYPNPTSGTFSVKSDGGYLAVYSLEGKAIVTYAVQAGVSDLSMPAGLAAGVYMCIFSNDKGNKEVVRLEYRP